MQGQSGRETTAFATTPGEAILSGDCARADQLYTVWKGAVDKLWEDARQHYQAVACQCLVNEHAAPVRQLVCCVRAALSNVWQQREAAALVMALANEPARQQQRDAPIARLQYKGKRCAWVALADKRRQHAATAHMQAMAEAYEQDCCARAGLVTVDALATTLDDVPYANGAAQQCRADDAALTKPPQGVDMAIWRIQAKYNLLTAPLDAILAAIACKDIAHPTSALPSPA